ncbi:hypothetical protein YN1_3600 [Nanoarchaeota archaeon]
MKKGDLSISYIILIIIGLVVLIFVVLFVIHNYNPIVSSQVNLTNTSNNQLNNTFGNITSMI